MTVKKSNENNLFTCLKLIFLRFTILISILMLLFLSVTSLLYTSYLREDYAEVILYKKDYFIITIIITIIFVIIMQCISKKVKQCPQTYIIYLLIYVMILGITWIIACRTKPVSDQVAVSSIASQFLDGNYSELDKGGYLYSYPYQLGIIGFIEIVYSIVGKDNYIFIMILNVFSVCISFYYLYKISIEIFKDAKTAVFLIILLAGCISAMFYCTYVYPTLFGLMFSIVGVYYQIRYYNTERIRYQFISIILIVIAVLLKNNYLIVLLASVIMLIFKFLSNRKITAIIIIGIFFIVNSLASTMLFNYYEMVSNKKVNDGAPKLLWIAMGLQPAGSGEGWYNEFNWKVYNDNYDSKKSNEIAEESIKASLRGFKKDPIYALKFFYNKITSQWNEPTYQSLWGSHYVRQHTGELSGVFYSIYEGPLNKIILEYLNIYQFIIWSCALYFFIRNRKNITAQQVYLIIIVIGGFLFHIMWEAKAQYILPYFIMVIPYSAKGLRDILEDSMSYIRKSYNKSKSIS